MFDKHKQVINEFATGISTVSDTPSAVYLKTKFDLISTEKRID
jgi:hypothetical protein